MNPLLFERSAGRLGPNEFARIQSTSLLRSFSAAPRFRFDGGEYAANGTVSAAGNSGSADGIESTSIRAHQAGVSALALERFDGRM